MSDIEILNLKRQIKIINKLHSYERDLNNSVIEDLKGEIELLQNKLDMIEQVLNDNT